LSSGTLDKHYDVNPAGDSRRAFLKAQQMAKLPTISFTKLETPASGSVIFLVGKDAGLGPVCTTIDAEGRLARALSISEFKGKLASAVEVLVPAAGFDRFVALGIGNSADNGEPAWLKVGGKARTLVAKAGEATIVCETAEGPLAPAACAAIAAGAKLRAYDFDAYRTRDKKDQKGQRLILACADPAAARKAWKSLDAITDGVIMARDLVNEPANMLGPVEFAKRAEALSSLGVEIEVLDEKAMRRLKMGALLGVAQGSVRPPRMVIMQWKGAKATEKPLAFIGKGVVFDTGGISMKPAAGMEDMKGDMGGAATVTGLMHALAARKAKVNAIGIIGLVENMPDGNAQRPGDVVTTMSGQTVEVINTDAEGRLVLCDVLTFVQREYNPSAIIDLATLTGAMIVSLGHEYGGMFANNEELATGIDKAGKASGDKVWRFPLGKAYDKLIDSQIADMKNMGARYGGSITAAQFLQRFIEDGRPWAHLDIAGMVWADKPGATWDKGATGFGVRLLDQFVRDTLEG
jgi:leucyl aminopeptidase